MDAIDLLMGCLFPITRKQVMDVDYEEIDSTLINYSEETEEYQFNFD